MQLPEKIRRPLEKLTRNLQNRETTYGISLFGSWSRGDADPSSSDVDLLLVDNQPLEYEFTERIEQNGVLIDLDHIPSKWITDLAPAEIDQKIHESYILYDREWKLANAKEHMMNSFYTPERYKIRTESYLLDADIYLSRATSANARGDYQSAHLFATLSAQAILKIAIEAAKLPLVYSHYLETLRTGTQMLDEASLLTDYLAISGLEDSNSTQVEKKLNHFKQTWDEIFTFTKSKASLLKSMHFKIRTRLNYYATLSFLQGVILRSQALLNEGALEEVANYLFSILVDALENYAWLSAAEHHVRLDCTTLIRWLRGMKQKPSTIYKNASKALGLEDTDENKAEKTIAEAKNIIFEIRRQRRTFFDQRKKETY